MQASCKGVQPEIVQNQNHLREPNLKYYDILYYSIYIYFLKFHFRRNVYRIAVTIDNAAGSRNLTAPQRIYVTGFRPKTQKVVHRRGGELPE